MKDLKNKKINNIHTLSYFKKRLKDNGYIVWDVLNNYAIEDPRKWTILVSPSIESLYITCLVNRDGSDWEKPIPEFEFHDGGLRFQKNLILKTASMEVIMNFLNKKGILPDTSKYAKEE